MVDVFISYSSSGAEIAQKLVTDLQSIGLTTWIDRNIGPGERRADAIRDATSQARAIILIIDSNRTTSHEQNERSIILETLWTEPNKLLIPLIINNAALPAFLYQWQAIKVEDLTNQWSYVLQEITNQLANHGSPNNSPTCKEIACLVHPSQILSSIFSTMGPLIITVSDDGKVRFWNFELFEEIKSFEHSYKMNSIALNYDERLLATGCSNGDIIIWDMKSDEVLRYFHSTNGAVKRVCFSPDGRFLATCGSALDVWIWEVESGLLVMTLNSHKLEVNSVCYSPDGKLLATCSNDKTIKIWDIQTGQVLKTLTGHTDAIIDISFSPDGLYLMSAGNDKFIRYWEIESGETISSLELSTKPTSVAFSPDGLFLAASKEDGVAKIWDIDTNNEVFLLKHGEKINEVAFSHDGSYISTVGSVNTVRIWEHPRTKRIKHLRKLEAEIEALQPSNEELLEFRNKLQIKLENMLDSKEYDKVKVIEYIYKLSEISKEIKDFEAALNYYKMAIEIIGSNSEDKKSVVKILLNLGVIKRKMGEFESSRNYLLQALEIYSNTSNSSIIATLMLNLGITLKETGELTSARNYLIKSLKILKEIFGLQHPSIATVLGCLGEVFAKMNEYTTAQKLIGEALEINIRSFGIDHPLVAKNWLELGLVSKEYGDYDKAVYYCKKALEILCNSYESINDYESIVKEIKNTLMYINEGQHCDTVLQKEEV